MCSAPIHGITRATSKQLGLSLPVDNSFPPIFTRFHLASNLSSITTFDSDLIKPRARLFRSIFFSFFYYAPPFLSFSLSPSSFPSSRRRRRIVHGLISKTEDGRARFNVGEAVNFDSRSENCLRPVTF